jgi:hypothetical protein
MADNSYNVEVNLASKNGYFTPAESNAYYKTRYARDGITVHWWGDGTGADNHDNIVNYLNNQAAAGQKSVNYVLSDNKITLCVSPDNVAWASQGGNPTTISVETQPTLGPEGYKKWGWLVDQLEQRYGKSLPLHRHSEFFNTSCPGSINLDRIRAEADRWKRGEYDQAAPAPPPQPVPTPSPAVPYTIEPITPKEVQLNKETHRWGLHYDNFTAIANNPEDTKPVSYIFTARAVLHHNIGYNYYLEDPNVPSGYNVLDCDDYNPAPVPPPLPPPPPPVPPSLPKPPSGPVVAPSTEPYQIIKNISGYTNSSFAINHTTPTVNVAAGSYYVFNRREPALNVTKVPGLPGSWINTLDNVPDPTPEELAAQEAAAAAAEANKWKDSYHAFPNPEYYVAMNEVAVPDLEGQRSEKRMRQYDVTIISGTFEKDGVIYARPQSGTLKGWWYGIPLKNPETGQPNLELESVVFDSKTGTAEHQALKNLSLHDYLVLAVAKIKHLWDILMHKEPKT